MESKPIINNFIDGKYQPPVRNEYLDNIDPSTSLILSKIPSSTKEDVDMAVEAAKKAIRNGWGRNPIAERIEICKKISKRIQERLPQLALAESKDTGKPLAIASNMDIPRASKNFEFFATAAEHLRNDMHPSDSGINYTTRTPIGIVGLITPWNLPLYLLSWKIAPALIMGNAIIAKPSEMTPTTAHMLAEICQEVGLPPGVLNILHGHGSSCGQAIVEHEAIKAISFTGGTKTGSIVGSSASKRFKKVSLELGGKNPNIIFADCDLDKAVQTSIRSSFANSGQICLCGSRILVESSIKDEFLKKFRDNVQKLRIGCPQDPETTTGSVITLEHREKIESYIEIAKKEGGEIICGGKRPNLEPPFDSGAFIEPTIITGVSSNSRIAQEEIFGPVVSIHEFINDEDAIKQANCVQYGLSASVWTSNLERAHTISNQLEAGIIWVNSWLVRDLRTPFGGMKMSGIGREGGDYSFDFFSNTKNIYIDLPSLSQSVSTTKQNLQTTGEVPSSTILHKNEMKKEFNVIGAPKAVGAYPHARRHGDFLFLSGIGPRQPETNKIPGGPIVDKNGNPLEYNIQAQTKAVIENVKTVLKGAGLTLQNVIDVQVFLVNMNRDFQGFNDVYTHYFSDIKATRTTCAISALPTPIAVEFKVIASMK